MKKSITWRSIISMVLALILCVSLPVTIWAETIVTPGTPVDNGDGTTTTTTTTTTTETDASGNTVVTVTIEKKTAGTLTSDGSIVDNTVTNTTTTTTDPNGFELGYTWSEDGHEKKTTITEDNGDEPGQPPATVPLEPGETTEGSSEPIVTENPDGTTTTEIDRTVTATTTEKEVLIEEELVEDSALSATNGGLKPEYDTINGKKEDKVAMFDYQFNSGIGSANDKDSKFDDAPEGGDLLFLGTGEHTMYYVAVVYVTYEKDENGNTLYDENGEPIIKNIRPYEDSPDSKIITLDGEIVTELPDEVTLKPAFDGYGGNRPFLNVLRDKDGNYVYAYCVENMIDTKTGDWYTITNLEDSDYFISEESELHIRCIAENGYWGTSDIPDADGNYKTGSLEKLKQDLKAAIADGQFEDSIELPTYNADGTPCVDADGNPITQTHSLTEIIDDLTAGEALCVTQAALWSYANGSYETMNGKDGYAVLDPDSYKANHLANAYHKKEGDTLDDFGSARMDLLYKWLISLTTPESATPDVIINEDNFVKDLTLTVLDKVADEAANQDDNKDNDVYNTNLNFKLAFIPGANDDLLVQINYVDYDGVSRSLTRRLAGANSAEQDYITILPDENGNYVIPNIKLSENDNFNFDLRLEGTQYLDRGAYLYTCVDENHQDFVGIAEGKRGVDVSIGVSVTFNVDENDKTIVERKWHDEGDPQNTPPTTPNTPSDDPTNPTGGDRQPEFGNYTPTLLSGDEEIEEEEVPLNEEPEVEEEDYEEDDEIEILDEEVPLAEVPETGDVSDVMMLLVILSVIGLIAINLPAKKRFNV